jgi:hypothetical protein
MNFQSWNVKLSFYLRLTIQKSEMSVAGGSHRDLLRGSIKILSWIVEKAVLPAAVFIAALSVKKPALK